MSFVVRSGAVVSFIASFLAGNCFVGETVNPQRIGMESQSTRDGVPFVAVLLTGSCFGGEALNPQRIGMESQSTWRDGLK